MLESRFSSGAQRGYGVVSNDISSTRILLIETPLTTSLRITCTLTFVAHERRLICSSDISQNLRTIKSGDPRLNDSRILHLGLQLSSAPKLSSATPLPEAQLELTCTHLDTMDYVENRMAQGQLTLKPPP